MNELLEDKYREEEYSEERIRELKEHYEEVFGIPYDEAFSDDIESEDENYEDQE